MKKQAFLVLLLSLSFFLQSCVLTIFPGFNTGCFYNGKLNASKIFWAVPCLSGLPDNWLYQVYHRAEAISFGQGLGNVQLAELMCYLSQMPCVLLVPVACATGRHRQCLQALDRCCTGEDQSCSAEANRNCGVKCEICQAEERAKLLISASPECQRLLLVYQHLF